MRRQKKWSCVCLFSILLLLTACHGQKERQGFTVPENFDDEKQIEISFWAKNDTNKTQTTIYENAIREFEKWYPNVKVNLRLYTDYGKIYNDVITNIATSTTPNVCITYPDHIATYLTGENVVVPLDELFADKSYGFGGEKVRFDAVRQEEMIPKFLEECYFRGHYYAVPFMRSTEACYVNQTMVEELGYTLPPVLTWDFVWEVSEKAAEKNADGTFRANGQKVMIPFIYKSTDNMMIQYLKQTGSTYSTQEGEIELFQEETKELLYTVSKHVKSGAFSTFKISSYPANFLNAGQCVFAVDSTAGATWMGTDAPLSDIAEEKLVRFETAVLPIPQADPEHPQMISQGPSVCIFNKADAQEVLASWLFVQYLLSDEVQMAYAETEGYIPVTKRAQENPLYQAYLRGEGEDPEKLYEVKLKATQLLLDHIDNTFVTPVFNGSASLRDAAGQLIENTAKSTRRKAVIDEAYMEALFADVTSLYRLDQISVSSAGKKKLGPMPTESKALLGALVLIWLGIGAYTGINLYKKSKKSSES